VSFFKTPDYEAALRIAARYATRPHALFPKPFSADALTTPSCISNRPVEAIHGALAQQPARRSRSKEPPIPIGGERKEDDCFCSLSFGGAVASGSPVSCLPPQSEREQTTFFFSAQPVSRLTLLRTQRGGSQPRLLRRGSSIFQLLALRGRPRPQRGGRLSSQSGLRVFGARLNLAALP